MSDLSLQKKAQRLRIYIGESDHWRGGSLASAILETLKSHGMAGATLFRGMAGFGAHSRIHTASIEVLSFDLPIVIDVVDTPEKIASALDIIYPMVHEGLITLEDVQIVKYTHRFLNPLPADRLVSEVMTSKVVTITPEMTVQLAWKQMLVSVIKVMPVINENRQVVGILTDEDLLERAGVQQRLSVAIKLDDDEISRDLNMLGNSPLLVKDVMSKPVITAQDSETLGAVTARMVKTCLKRFPVVDKNGKLVGMLSRLDILRQVANSQQIASTAHLPTGAARTVKDIMTSDIPAVSQNDNLSTIIDKFSQCNSNRLIVVDTKGKVVGLISDSDIVARIQPEKRGNILDALRRIGKPPAGKETAFELMSPGPLTAPPDLTVVDAVKMMLAESRKWLVVIDDKGHPLGLVDRQILLESIAAFLRKTTQYFMPDENHK